MNDQYDAVNKEPKVIKHHTKHIPSQNCESADWIELWHWSTTQTLAF